MKPQIEVSTTTTRRSTIKLNRETIVALLAKHAVVPADARVTFDVPSGGDYSGMQCDVNDDTPVWVTWETSDVKDER